MPTGLSFFPTIRDDLAVFPSTCNGTGLALSKFECSGLSNSLVGVKWRFLDEDKVGFNMSFYPQVEFNNPTGSVNRGLADQGPNRLVPPEVSSP